RFLSFLTLGTPVGHARVVALRPGADSYAAARTGSPLAAVRLRVSGDTLEPAAHEAMRLLERRAQLLVGDLREPSPWRDTRPPERLRLPEVADSGHESLVEQGVTGLALLVRAPESREHGVVVGLLREDVGTETARDAAVELQHRAVEHRSDVVVPAEHEPWLAEDRRVPAEDAPASLHAQMAAEHEPALEAEQKVLADRLDVLQAAAV